MWGGTLHDEGWKAAAGRAGEGVQAVGRRKRRKGKGLAVFGLAERGKPVRLRTGETGRNRTKRNEAAGNRKVHFPWDGYGSYLYAEYGAGMDFYFIAGEGQKDVWEEYGKLCGNAF